MSAGALQRTKQIYRIVSRDKHVFEMHDPNKPGDSKVMEITYTRKVSQTQAASGQGKGTAWK